MSPSCALLGGFAIGARVALLWQRNANAKRYRVHACTRSMPSYCCWLSVQTMADMSGIEKAVRVALGGAVTSVTWSSRGAFQKQQQQQQQLQQQQQQQQMQSRMDAQRSFATPSAGLGPINQQYTGMTPSMTSQQVRAPSSFHRLSQMAHFESVIRCCGPSSPFLHLPPPLCLSVCPSVRPSVRLSHAGIVSKRRHVARCSLHCQIARFV